MIKPLCHFISTRFLLVAVLSLLLVACGGGGSSSTITPSATGAAVAGLVEEDIELTGSVGDGPVTGATVEIWSAQGRLLRSVLSDNSASFRSRIRVRSSYYPLLLKVRGGIDLVTGRAPDFQMVSVVLGRYARQVNINPFSTLIVRIAQHLQGGINAQNIGQATAIVTGQLGFGLDPALISDPVSIRLTDTNIANLLKASETLGEMVRRTRDRIASTGRETSGDAVLDRFTADLLDGTLDGRGGSGADPLVAAVARVVGGQVLVEALANTLKVDGIIATRVIDQAIMTTRPGIDSAYLTQGVRVTDRMLLQTRIALMAARSLDDSSELAGLDTIVSGIRAGALPGDVATVLPADASRALDNALLNALTADATQLAAVNSTGQDGVADTGTATPEPTVTEPAATSEPAATDPVATDPTVTEPIATTDPVATDPATTDPTATDPTVTQPIATTDPVATDPATTDPTATDPTVTEPIATTDPVATDPAATTATDSSEPANTAPVISGSPSGSVVAGSDFSFQPHATDADGDSLTFSIAGRPAWAAFDSRTGLLSGRPGDGDAGTYRNILIAVSDATDTATLPPFSITVEPAPATTGDLALSWTPPVSRTDSSPIALSEIGGYRIYFGPAAGSYPDTVEVSGGSADTVTISGVPVGTYHVVMTTYDSNGQESDYSPEIVKAVP